MPKVNSKIKPSTVLKKAKRVLLDNKFGKGAYARKANGHTACDVMDRAATCFCAMGALYKAAGLTFEDNTEVAPDNVEKAENLLEDAATKYTGVDVYHISLYNDRKPTTKKNMLDVFDIAIAIAKKKGE